MSVGDIMSTLGVFSTLGGGGGFMSTLRDTKMHVWGIMSIPGMFSTLEAYHEYTGGIPWVHRGILWVHRGILVHMRKDHHKIFRIFVLAPFTTMQLYMLAFGTSDRLLKFIYQVARAQTLTHFLFHLWSKVFSFGGVLMIMYQSIPSLTIPPGDPRGFAHSSCPGVGFSLLCLARGVLNQSKSSIILKKSAIFALSLKQLSSSSFQMFIYARSEQREFVPIYTVTSTAYQNLSK